MRAAILALGFGLTAGGAFAQQDLRFNGGVGDFDLSLSGVQATVMHADDGMLRLAIAMDSENRLRFATFTALSVGEDITATLCGHQIVQARLQAQIDSGYVMSSPLDADLAHELADVINGLRGCAD